MIIHKAQFQKLAGELLNDFHRRLAVELSLDFPHWLNTSAMEEKVQEVRKLTEYAQGINIRQRTSLANFARYMIRFNRNPPLKHEWIQELKNGLVREDVRIENLFIQLASDREHLKQLTLK